DDELIQSIGGKSLKTFALIGKSKTTDFDQNKLHAKSNNNDISVVQRSMTDGAALSPQTSPSPSQTENESEKDPKTLELNRGYYKQLTKSLFCFSKINLICCKYMTLVLIYMYLLQKNVKPKTGSDNPFNHRLKKNSTRLVLQQMETIQQEQAKLPVLEAFLEKKQPRAPYSWQKRWVVVKHGHMLWSDKQRDIVDASNSQERNKFNGQVSIMHIVEWGPIETRSNNKFYLIANTDKAQKRRFEFKAVSEQDRDFWLKGIQAHINHEKKMIQYLEQNS
ncbi:hypothetical protein RFI_21099, partial [Reticulomyxa filosa]